MKNMTRIVATSFSIVTLLLASSTRAQNEEDDFLLSIPPIIAGQTTEPEPEPEPEVETPFSIQQVQRLGGRWRFSREGSTFDDFFRFQASEAVQVSDDGVTGASILGESHIDELFDFQTNEAPLLYLDDPAGWIIFDPFGPPLVDLGNLYVFTQFGTTISASSFFFNPSTGDLSTGIATPATGNRISTQFKSAAKTLSRAEKVEALIQLHQQQVDAIAESPSLKADNKTTQQAQKMLDLFYKR